MKPPESARNAPEAPKFDASQTPPTASIEAKKAPEYELPTDLKLPTEFKIQTPSVPDGIDAPAGGEKT
jgi:hypothetical protein